MGTLDRALRGFMVAPGAIVAAFFVGPSTVGGIVLFVVAGVMLATATSAFCPTYTLLGISTNGTRRHRIGVGIRHGHA